LENGVGAELPAGVHATFDWLLGTQGIQGMNKTAKSPQSHRTELQKTMPAIDGVDTAVSASSPAERLSPVKPSDAAPLAAYSPHNTTVGQKNLLHPPNVSLHLNSANSGKASATAPLAHVSEQDRHQDGAAVSTVGAEDINRENEAACSPQRAPSPCPTVGSGLSMIDELKRY